MWKTVDLSLYPAKNSYHVWKKFFPSYELYPVYKSYLYSIERTDLTRLIILHSFAEIYAELSNVVYLLTNFASFIRRQTIRQHLDHLKNEWQYFYTHSSSINRIQIHFLDVGFDKISFNHFI
ncbi:unnamed protein product [Adineta ricciae]|uniref:Uncharacterized protein n=1 Tax=Adineta ricciae TaxID=249248 RepID=A0A815VT26_ADIRI|nr:unnamed protein product [Adineta ricciae]